MTEKAVITNRRMEVKIATIINDINAVRKLTIDRKARKSMTRAIQNLGGALDIYVRKTKG